MTDHIIKSVEELEAVYDAGISEASVIKESDRVTDEYRQLIEASTFLALASVGADEIDCSPRGDRPGFVRVQDEKTLLLPDRRGNNRIDTLRNVVRDPRVSLMFLIPGSGTVLRVNGRAVLSTAPDLLESFIEKGKPPRSVMVVTIDVMYFQCARAILRSKLWDPSRHVEPNTLPTPGKILAAMTADKEDGGFDGEKYDNEWPERAAKSMW